MAHFIHLNVVILRHKSRTFLACHKTVFLYQPILKIDLAIIVVISVSTMLIIFCCIGASRYLQPLNAVVIIVVVGVNVVVVVFVFIVVGTVYLLGAIVTNLVVSLQSWKTGNKQKVELFHF